MYSLIERLLLESSEKDYQKTQLLISSIEDQFDFVNDFMKKSISHILNHHHILNSRLLSKNPESDLWDPLPLNFMSKLHAHNYIVTKNLIEQFFIENSNDRKITVFYNNLLHLFEHSNYHRSQIIYVMKSNELKTPNLQMIMIQ